MREQLGHVATSSPFSKSSCDRNQTDSGRSALPPFRHRPSNRSHVSVPVSGWATAPRIPPGVTGKTTRERRLARSIASTRIPGAQNRKTFPRRLVVGGAGACRPSAPDSSRRLQGRGWGTDTCGAGAAPRGTGSENAQAQESPRVPW